MEPECGFPESRIAKLRRLCTEQTCLAAVYVFGPRESVDCALAALYSEPPSWADRLDAELAVAQALGIEGVELIDLRRMPLVSRFGVVNEGDPVYVGYPDVLAEFIEETIARYSAFYPLLEALYWKVETKARPEDRLDEA
jgi:hypothetical protein